MSFAEGRLRVVKITYLDLTTAFAVERLATGGEWVQIGTSFPDLASAQAAATAALSAIELKREQVFP